jgi:hypothetical protein
MPGLKDETLLQRAVREDYGAVRAAAAFHVQPGQVSLHHVGGPPPPFVAVEGGAACKSRSGSGTVLRPGPTNIRTNKGPKNKGRQRTDWNSPMLFFNNLGQLRAGPRNPEENS